MVLSIVNLQESKKYEEEKKRKRFRWLEGPPEEGREGDKSEVQKVLGSVNLVTI